MLVGLVVAVLVVAVLVVALVVALVVLVALVAVAVLSLEITNRGHILIYLQQLVLVVLSLLATLMNC